jgi:BASS family bile acid:Na+ symporter
MPTVAKRIARPIGMLSMLVLVGCLIPILVTSWPQMKLLIGNGTLVAIVALTLVAMGVGYAFGGPHRDQRIVLALATSTRHPGLAIAIAAASFPDEKLVPAAVILYLIVASIVTAPLVARQKRERQARAAPTRQWIPARTLVARDSIGRIVPINDRRR